MRHNDDAFTAMLLTLPLTANKDELVRPLSSAEFSILRARVAACGARRIGDLIGLDVSGIMNLLKVPEAEAYRLCMLLCRTMPLSYAMERFYEQNLELLTLYDSAYPENLATRLGDDAPAAMYMCGDASILSMPLVGILGIALPAFHVVALLVPLFFPRIAIMFRPLFKGLDERKEDV